MVSGTDDTHGGFEHQVSKRRLWHCLGVRQHGLFIICITTSHFVSLLGSSFACLGGHVTMNAQPPMRIGGNYVYFLQQLSLKYRFLSETAPRQRLACMTRQPFPGYEKSHISQDISHHTSHHVKPTVSSSVSAQASRNSQTAFFKAYIPYKPPLTSAALPCGSWNTRGNRIHVLSRWLILFRAHSTNNPSIK